MSTLARTSFATTCELSTTPSSSLKCKGAGKTRESGGDQMEKETNNNTNGGSGYWWWAAASGVQVVYGIYSIRKGYSGDSRLMPLKAFGIASLFVGATATATVGTLSASGIHSVTDAVELGASIRSSLGVKGRG
ncbi:uncharacterized protein [Rutidosis leptorrhynchoides]|uniref:uncharacterized protein isoform X2 n=1 Tax=Rutidosis leptorrhynchoides TaxID=125765 RepID=UPI003A9A24F6